jgi:hypothetical protein
MSNYIKPKRLPNETDAEYNLRMIQANCKHNKGFRTNTEGKDSFCVECGKPWYLCNKEN